MCAELQAAGVTINRPPRDGHMAFVRSPDNVSVELLQDGARRCRRRSRGRACRTRAPGEGGGRGAGGLRRRRRRRPASWRWRWRSTCRGRWRRASTGCRWTGSRRRSATSAVAEALVAGRMAVAVIHWSGVSRQAVAVPWTRVEDAGGARRAAPARWRGAGRRWSGVSRPGSARRCCSRRRSSARWPTAGGG